MPDPPFRGAKVLVTGASGFLGGHLCPRLGEAGADVLPLELADCNLADYPAVERGLRDFRPDIVYHLAGLVTGAADPGLILPTLHSNVAGTVNLLEALRRQGVRKVVVIGSVEEPIPGATPASPYAASKACASLYAAYYAERLALPLVRVRLHYAYGPGQGESKLVPHIVLSYLRGGEPAIRTPDRVCDLVFIDDVISGLLRAGQDPAGDLSFEIRSGCDTRIGDLAGAVARLTGAAGRHELPEEVWTNLARQPMYETRPWNWHPAVSLLEGLRRTIAWYLDLEVRNRESKR